MQKSYIMHYAIIGLSMISLSLSGMQLEQNSISIPSAIVSLFSTGHQQLQSTNKAQANIDFSIPPHIEKKTMVQLVDLLDQCLLINTENLEKYITENYKYQLQKSIQNNTLEDLIKLFNAIDYLKITPQHNGKELILPLLAQQIFLDKITKEDYTNRKKIINQLNNARQANLSSYLIHNIKDQKNKKNFSQILFELFTQFIKNENQPGKKQHALTTITNPDALQDHLKLTLEQVLLINDILKDNSSIESPFLLPIPDLVKRIILNNQIQKMEKQQQEIDKIIGPRPLQKTDKHEKNEQQITEQPTVEKSTITQLKQLFTTHKKTLILSVIALIAIPFYSTLFAISLSDNLKNLIFLKIFNIFNKR